MPGDDEGNREDGDFLAAGRATAQPGCVIKGTDKGNGGAADGGEFLQQIGKLAGRSVRELDVVVLLEAGERGLVSAGDAKNSDGEDALGVVYVAENFLDGTFARGDAEIGLRVGNRLQ